MCLHYLNQEKYQILTNGGGSMEGLILFFLLLWIFMSGTIAYNRNRNWIGWALLGLLIGPFAVIWVAILGPLED